MYRLLFYVYVCVKAAVRQFKCIMKYLVDKQKRVAKKRVMGIEPTYPAWTGRYSVVVRGSISPDTDFSHFIYYVINDKFSGRVDLF